MSIFKILKWLVSPWLKIWLRDVVGTDGVTRRCCFWVGLLWELHMPGYWLMWYDGPIHNFSLGFLTVYWHRSFEDKK